MNFSNFVNENPGTSIFIIIVLLIVVMNVMSYGHSIIITFINRNKPGVTTCCDHECDDDDDD